METPPLSNPSAQPDEDCPICEGSGVLEVCQAHPYGCEFLRCPRCNERPPCPACDDSGLIAVCYNNNPNREATIACDQCDTGRAYQARGEEIHAHADD